MNAGRFAKILQLGAQVLPHDDVEVEVEYDCCVTVQYPVGDVTLSGDHLDIQLGEKHTECLAKKQCGTEEADSGTGKRDVANGEVVPAGCC